MTATPIGRDSRASWLAAALTALPLVTGACAAQGNDQPRTSGPADSAAQTMLQASADATRKLTSAHVDITTAGKIERLGPVTKVDADVAASPLIANGQVTYDNGTTAPFVLDRGFVSVKQGNTWTEVGATSTFVPPTVIDPSQGLPTLLDAITDVKMAGSERIDAVATKKVTGTMPTDKLKSILPESNSAANFTAWIRDGADPVLVRAAIDLSVTQSLTVTLSKWNAPVHVTDAPAA